MFERNFDEPATVVLCKLELCVQFKIGVLIWYNLWTDLQDTMAPSIVHKSIQNSNIGACISIMQTA